MPLFERLAGAIASFFQIGGPTGPGWNANAGALEARNAANSAFAITRGATPIAANDLIPLGYLGTIGAIAGITTAAFASENNVGNSGTGINVNWTTAQQQLVTLTGNCTFTFTNPPGVGTYLLRLVQGAGGPYTAAWPAVKWVGSAPPVITPTVGAIDIISLYWNGTNYYATYSQNFG
jgi:hypothetical protein